MLAAVVLAACASPTHSGVSITTRFDSTRNEWIQSTQLRLRGDDPLRTRLVEMEREKDALVNARLLSTIDERRFQEAIAAIQSASVDLERALSRTSSRSDGVPAAEGILELERAVTRVEGILRSMR